jgi:hypothetical protein
MGNALFIVGGSVLLWFFMLATSRAQYRLLIARMDGTNTGRNIVRVAWRDSNDVALASAPTINGPWKPLVYRVDTNRSTFTVTVHTSNEKDAEFLRLSPKFTGSIPEAARK